VFSDTWTHSGEYGGTAIEPETIQD
jgi:hypothetical protein